MTDELRRNQIRDDQCLNRLRQRLQESQLYHGNSLEAYLESSKLWHTYSGIRLTVQNPWDAFASLQANKCGVTFSQMSEIINILLAICEEFKDLQDYSLDNDTKSELDYKSIPASHLESAKPDNKYDKMYKYNEYKIGTTYFAEDQDGIMFRLSAITNPDGSLSKITPFPDRDGYFLNYITSKDRKKLISLPDMMHKFGDEKWQDLLEPNTMLIGDMEKWKKSEKLLCYEDEFENCEWKSMRYINLRNMKEGYRISQHSNQRYELIQYQRDTRSGKAIFKRKFSGKRAVVMTTKRLHHMRKAEDRSDYDC
ncbi:MAG: hypothetical protein GY928_35920 [Colwellia sp.]|nr:hypothetical protein [Colwellia sp.]